MWVLNFGEKLRITYIKVWGATKSEIIITHYSIALNLIYFLHHLISSSCPSIGKESKREREIERKNGKERRRVLSEQNKG